MKIDDNFGELKTLIRRMKKKKNRTFKIITCVRKDIEWMKKVREMMRTELNTLSEEILIKVWRRREMFKKTERSKITKRLNEEMKKRRGKPFLNKITLWIPRYFEMGKKELYKTIHRWIGNLDMSIQWKKLLTEEIKIVEIRNKTIGEMFLNYRECARSDLFKINKCVCLEKERRREERR